MNNFDWTTEGPVQLPPLHFDKITEWLIEVARRHDRIVGDVNYVFCDDETILRVNREYLSHDYYTDIITFDRSMRRLVRGDIYLSLDTVTSNAAQLHQEYDRELKRVIAHGLLHLCGIDDKGPGEREIMEQHENDALALLAEITAN